MEKIDIVYILGKGSRWHNNELRFSLRSLEKNFKYRNIFIIGDLPEWIQNVIHIPIDDSFKNKLQNARTKYLAACNDHRISNNFILMNDDFFFMKPMENIPYYSRGASDKQIETHQTKNGYYYESLKRTKDRMISMGFENKVMDFEVHAPIIFNKEDLKTTIAVVGNQVTCLLRTVYGNIHQYNNRKVVDDFKVSDDRRLQKEINRDREFLSISDSMVVSEKFRKWIWDKFPGPSKYEEDLGLGSIVSPGNRLQNMRYYAVATFSYQDKRYQAGDMIDLLTIKEIKLCKALKDNWEYK